MNLHSAWAAPAAEPEPRRPPEKPVRGKRAARLRLTVEYVRAHLHEPRLNAHGVGKHLGLSGRSVQLLFGAEGLTFSAYVREQRLLKAYADFKDPGLDLTPISEIAYRAGFVDISHFNRCFRRRFGATPSAVRLRAP